MAFFTCTVHFIYVDKSNSFFQNEFFFKSPEVHVIFYVIFMKFLPGYSDGV